MGPTPEEWIAEFNLRAAGTMVAAHGTRFKEITPQRAILELDFRPDLAQPTGLFHAGALISLADEAATCLAVAHVMPDGGWDPAKFPLTVQLSANLIRNTNRGTIRAEATPLHMGKTTIVIQIRVTDDADRLLALVTATLIVPGR
ncbi:MAG TPA: PaaI family thioesterase [Candidatus Methylomirabilis sp.]|jgi:uncharacterized protein (TIGR00369 family)